MTSDSLSQVLRWFKHKYQTGPYQAEPIVIAHFLPSPFIFSIDPSNGPYFLAPSTQYYFRPAPSFFFLSQPTRHYFLGHGRPRSYKSSTSLFFQATVGHISTRPTQTNNPNYKQASPTRLHYIYHKFMSTYNRVNSFHRLNKQTSFYSLDDQNHIRTSVHMKVFPCMREQISSHSTLATGNASALFCTYWLQPYKQP